MVLKSVGVAIHTCICAVICGNVILAYNNALQISHTLANNLALGDQVSAIGYFVKLAVIGDLKLSSIIRGCYGMHTHTYIHSVRHKHIYVFVEYLQQLKCNQLII